MKFASLFTVRKLNIYMMCTCFGLLAMAAYLQIVHEVEPCPLCIIQRILIAFLMLVFLIGAVFRNAPKRFTFIHSLVVILFSVLGLVAAGRQVWLQSVVVDEVPVCGPGLDFLFDKMSFTDALAAILTGPGSCSEVEWTLFHLSIPMWTLLFFTLFAIVGIINLRRVA